MLRYSELDSKGDFVALPLRLSWFTLVVKYLCALYLKTALEIVCLRIMSLKMRNRVWLGTALHSFQYCFISCNTWSLGIPNTFTEFILEGTLKSQTGLLNSPLNWKRSFIYCVAHELRPLALSDSLEKPVVQYFARKYLKWVCDWFADRPSLKAVLMMDL